MKRFAQRILPPFLFDLLSYIHLNFFMSGCPALDNIDRKLIAIIKPRRNGYFVELGANDGVSQSNTYKLQKSYGWTGLLIEASPIRFIECLANRSFGNRPKIFCNACVSEDFANYFVELVDCDLMSTVAGLDVTDDKIAQHIARGRMFQRRPCGDLRYGVPARTLTSLLSEAEAPNQFEFLSIDVEGNELAVLLGLDFRIYQPKWILVETRESNESSIELHLKKAGYTYYCSLSTHSSYKDVLFRHSLAG